MSILAGPAGEQGPDISSGVVPTQRKGGIFSRATERVPRQRSANGGEGKGASEGDD